MDVIMRLGKAYVTDGNLTDEQKYEYSYPSLLKPIIAKFRDGFRA